jgi:hypothetical protein
MINFTVGFLGGVLALWLALSIFAVVRLIKRGELSKLRVKGTKVREDVVMKLGGDEDAT